MNSRERGRPLLIAHRAANDTSLLAPALEAGADYAEADAWFYEGRVEIRHEKTMGPVPLRWDRWKLERRGPPRLELADLLGAMPEGLGLMLDLKGRDRRLPGAVLRTLDMAGFAGPLIMSARRPELLPEPGKAGIPVFPSAGSERDLAALEGRVRRTQWAGIGMHMQLLDPGRVTRLRRLAPRVLTWPVNSIADAERMARLGVDGLISDRLDVIRAMREQQER